MPTALRFSQPHRSAAPWGAAWCAIALLLSGCPSQPTDGPATQGGGEPTGDAQTTQFEFITDNGLNAQNVVYDNGRKADRHTIIETIGGGVGVLDFDRDGRDDLFFPGGGTLDGNSTIGPLPGRLLRAGLDSIPNAVMWQDVTAAAGVDAATSFSHGAYCCDYDNDGFRDLLTTGFAQLTLYRNLGDGSFLDVTAEVGLDVDDTWSIAAAWGDVNGDGRADLYVGHYVDWEPGNDPVCGLADRQDVCPPKVFEALPDAIYVQTPEGRFKQHMLPPADAKTLASLLTDVDTDGDLDLLVANDTTANLVYRNETPRGAMDLQLVEEGTPLGFALDENATMAGSMGIALTDFNNDLKPDYWVTNYEYELLGLYRNEGAAGFSHVSRKVGIERLGLVMVSFGCAAIDFDHDGDEDVVVTNGHVKQFPRGVPELQEPILLEAVEQQGRPRFVRTQPSGYFGTAHRGRGLAYADFDADNRLDLIFSNSLEPAAVAFNRTIPKGKSIVLELVGRRTPGTPGSAREPVGTQLLATLESGRVLYRQVTGGTSFASTPAPIVHIAWPNDDPCTSIEIRWPNGAVETLNPKGLPKSVFTGRTLRYEPPAPAATASL